MTITVEFAPPGPGGWMALSDHFPGPLTAEYRLLYTETAPAGMAAYMERYGVLAKGIDIAFVHGHMYLAPVPLAGPRELRRTPPTAAVWLMSRLHPAFRRRAKAAARTLAARPWRDAATNWFASERAQWRERFAAFEAIDPARLSDAELIAHLAEARDHVVAGYRRHFELHGDDLLPVGLLIARCGEWGIDPATSMGALHGASPLSAGTTEPESWQLVTGYDLDSLAWCELASRTPPRPAPELAATDLRPLVPEQFHRELADLVADARGAVPLRDDNGAITGAWPMGLLRRAMLEAGRRVVSDDPTLAVEATASELAARLDGVASPTPAELVARRDERAVQSELDAPLMIGSFAIPPISALPRPLALIGAAQLASADHMRGLADEVVGIGTHAVTGRALVVDDPGVAFDLLEPGDVVVTRFTSPSWNHVLVGAAGLVTTTGGVASHAAVLARELGIPAVIGDATAMKRLSTGQLVTIDPVAARVSISESIAP